MESLHFEILALYQNDRPLNNASCTFILGHTCVDSSIPTQNPIRVRIDNISETESLLILFKQGEDVVAKASKSLSELRQNHTFESLLEGLDSEDHKLFYNKYTWDHSYSILREDKSLAQSLDHNPFKGNLMKSPEAKIQSKGHESRDKAGASPDKLNLSKNSEQGLASFDADAKGFSPVKNNDSPAKVKVEHYLGVLEAKLGNAMKAENPIAPQLVQLVASIRSSVNELERSQLGVSGISNILPPNQITENSLDNHSPKFGKNPFAIFLNDPNTSEIQKIDINKIKILTQYTDIIIKPDYSGPIPEIVALEVREEVKRDEDEEAEHEHEEEIIEDEEEREEDEDGENLLNEMGEGKEQNEENSFPKSVAGSLQEEVQIDRNQEFLLEVKSQLATKVLTNLSDGFTRELVMQMSRSKKKVVAVKLKKSIKLRTKDEVEIEPKSYFRDGCERKCLHYFQPFTKYLHFFNLSKPFDVIQEKSQVISLDIDFDISPHCKSVVTPSGLIFLVSGKAEPSATDLDDSTGSLHIYNTYGQTLIEKAPMSAARRKNFGLCYMSKNLFVVAGIVNGILSNYCERYDIRSNEWLEIAPMNKKLRDISLCSFNNRYIYRFFGINQMGMVDSSIERYDAVRDKWVLMTVTIPDQLNNIHMPLCAQVNEDHIFIFGGRTSSGFPAKVNKGYVLKIEDKRRSTTAEILQTKNFVSGLAGNFSQNTMIAHEGEILFLRESY